VVDICLRWLFSPDALLRQDALLMKKEADYFDDVEPELIFIARRLRDAIHLESVLTGAGVDYAVEPDEYEGGVIFKSMRVGAFFYVRPELRERALEVMAEHGYVPAK
jgi:hypothetical protein